MNVTCCVLWGGSRSMKPCVFRVRWLQPAMKGTSCVRRLRLRSFGSFYVFCNNGASCVCSSMRFLKLWLQIHVHWNGCMNVAWAMFWGGSRSTKPCVFPCKVAAADDERYLVCATGAAAVVLCANCSSYVFCNEWLCLCA